MKLATVERPDGSATVAAAFVAEGKTWLADMAPDRGGLDMISLIAGGDEAMTALRTRLDSILSDIEGARSRGLVLSPDDVRFLPPIPRPGKIIGVGVNFRDHVEQAARQLGEDSPVVQTLRSATEPVGFAKLPSTQIGHGGEIAYPAITEQFDFEAELGVVIGKPCRNISPDEAKDAIAGYMNTNDLSLREVQMAEMAQGILFLGKNVEGTLPAGPYLVTTDEIEDPEALNIRCWVNGRLLQDGSTATMVHPVAKLVSHFSRFMTLEPGDMFITGSPAHADIPMPERFLTPGDVIEIEISGLGRLCNTIGPKA